MRKGKLQRLKASLKRLDYNAKRDFVAFGADGEVPEFKTTILIAESTAGWKFLPASAVARGEHALDAGGVLAMLGSHVAARVDVGLEIAQHRLLGPEEAQRELLRLSARALGIATEFDLRDYFRLGVAETKLRLAELVEAGDLLLVEVEGWKRPAYLDPAARQPRRIEARALLAPFDPLIWERDRTHRIFDFFYRIGIYTPVAKRTHGYYDLPFLLGDRLVARVDLKADRAAGRLLVHAAHLEPGHEARQVAGPLREELRLMADWLGLESVSLPRAGALAKAIGRMR